MILPQERYPTSPYSMIINIIYFLSFLEIIDVAKHFSNLYETNNVSCRQKDIPVSIE